MVLTASDVVELVEVSATGYKTVRYWLTFDRETHLHAHLEKGTGSVEATEEQTLVALGELASPDSVAAANKAAAKPAAAAVAVVEKKTAAVETHADTAKTIDHSTPSAPTTEARLAPRKIGHSADSPDALAVDVAPVKSSNVKVVADQDQAAPAVDSATPPPSPAVAMPDPTPAWTQPEPAPSAPVVATPAPEPAVAKPMPAAPAPAKVAAAGPSIISPKLVHKLAGDAPQIIMDHYDGDDLPATITAKLCIDTGGHVTSAVLLGKVQASRLGNEIAATLRTWTYAPYSKDGTATAACFPVALRTR
jgi:hypothetical protein